MKALKAIIEIALGLLWVTIMIMLSILLIAVRIIIMITPGLLISGVMFWTSIKIADILQLGTTLRNFGVVILAFFSAVWMIALGMMVDEWLDEWL